MFKKMLLTAGLGIAATGFAAAQTVTVSLTSPQDGMTVAGGSTVNWQISFEVSSGDNAGLALLIADLTQDLDPNTGNPGSLDIPPANGVPGAMTNFARPAGLSNPAESAPGYQGVQRGDAGAMNLVQIGGGQNTFGVAQPGGTGIAENANVAGGVGQSGAVVLASGSFTAPAAEGDYTFSLANVVANVVTTVNAPPAFSPVEGATVALASDSFSFTVMGGAGCAGDIDGMNGTDLNDLLILLGTFGNPGGPADLDGMNGVDLNDLLILLGDFGCV